MSSYLPLEYVEYRGVNGLVAAEVLQDDKDGFVTGDVFAVAGVAEVSKTVTQSTEAHYYDNIAAVVVESQTTDQITISASAIPLDVLAYITGQYYDATTAAMITSKPETKYFAIGYQYQNTKHENIYCWRYKGTFAVPDKTVRTLDNSTDANGQELIYTGIQTKYRFEKTGKPAKAINVDTSKGLVDVTGFFDEVTTPDSIGKEADPDCLKFESENDFALGWRSTTVTWDGTIEYSTDGATWSEFAPRTTVRSVNGKAYFRGRGNTTINKTSVGSGGFKMNTVAGGEIKCSGSVETMLDFETVKRGEHPTMAKDALGALFEGCKVLTQAPTLDAPTMTIGCYYRMFALCENLKTPPELPALQLATRCYVGMFAGSGITTAPELPATTMYQSCYSRMFDGCAGLEEPPELPATTLAISCYAYMFSGSGITTAPELHATTLANYCYENMFVGCENLTTPPVLPATQTKAGCYKEMFSGCVNLTALPQLPALQLVQFCYQQMFDGCAAIKLSTEKTGIYQTAFRVPTTGSITTQGDDTLADMFANTGGTFTGTPTIETTYYYGV